MVSRKPALSEAEGDLHLHFPTYATNFSDAPLEIDNSFDRDA